MIFDLRDWSGIQEIYVGGITAIRYGAGTNLRLYLHTLEYDQRHESPVVVPILKLVVPRSALLTAIPILMKIMEQPESHRDDH